jgi:hypothetical protein
MPIPATELRGGFTPAADVLAEHPRRLIALLKLVGGAQTTDPIDVVH